MSFIIYNFHLHKHLKRFKSALLVGLIMQCACHVSQKFLKCNYSPVQNISRKLKKSYKVRQPENVDICFCVLFEFSNISLFPKFLSLTLLGNLWSNLHIKFLELDIMFGFTCVSGNCTKFPNIMNRIVKVTGVIQINIFKISFERYIQNSASLFSFTDWEPTDEIICFKVNILIQIVLIVDSIFCDDEMIPNSNYICK